MNFVSNTLKDAANRVGVVDDPASLRTILQPGSAAAIWRRQTHQRSKSDWTALTLRSCQEGKSLCHRTL